MTQYKDKLLSIEAKKVTVTTTASELVAGDGYNSIIILNTSSDTVYIGGSGVDATDGFPVGSASDTVGTSLSLDARHGALYAVAATSVDIKILVGR